MDMPRQPPVQGNAAVHHLHNHVAAHAAHQRYVLAGDKTQVLQPLALRGRAGQAPDRPGLSWLEKNNGHTRSFRLVLANSWSEIKPVSRRSPVVYRV